MGVMCLLKMCLRSGGERMTRGPRAGRGHGEDQASGHSPAGLCVCRGCKSAAHGLGRPPEVFCLTHVIFLSEYSFFGDLV